MGFGRIDGAGLVWAEELANLGARARDAEM
jgi:hypothetical protein